ncbi:MAG: hypothetical protein ACTSO9_04900 [Candidatus Helarchaeota archaeon]
MAEFLKPLVRYGFKHLEITKDKKISKLYLITKPRKLEDLLSGEIELRTEIYFALGSELLTYGIEKILSLLSGIRGDETPPEFTFTIKYDVIRIEPPYTDEDEQKAQELYQQKINKPVSQFIETIGNRMKKGREFIEDTEKFTRKEGSKVVQEEIVRRLRKTGKELGFDLSRITKRTERVLDAIINIVGEREMTVVPEYRALIKPKSKREINPQLVIHQTGKNLRILGGSQITTEEEFDDIEPELLHDALKFMLLTKAKTKQNFK